MYTRGMTRKRGGLNAPCASFYLPYLTTIMSKHGLNPILMLAYCEGEIIGMETICNTPNLGEKGARAHFKLKRSEL